MSHFASRYWTAELPDSWVAEQEEDVDTLYDPDGFGSLQISALPQQEPVDDDFLNYLASEHLEAGARPDPVRFGQFSGFTLSYGAEDGFWTEWYLRAGRLALFISYTCAPEHELLEEEIIEGVLKSLTPSQDVASGSPDKPA